MYKILLGLAGVMFTFEHPLFVALSCLIYLFSQNITKEDKTMLKDFASNGQKFLKELNQTVKEKDFVSVKFGRELVGQTVDSLFNALSTEQLTKFKEDEILQDKVNRFIVDYLETPLEEVGQGWEEDFSILENDAISSTEKEFISYHIPNWDFGVTYTPKLHRQLFKNLKAKFRNSDGSIKDELGNKAAIMLEDWFSAVFTNGESTLFGKDDNVMNYLYEEGYKNAKKV